MAAGHVRLLRVLPQLLAGCGVRYLVTQKIFWSYNEGDPFPYHYFSWKGMDGSQVVSFLPTNYTYRTDPKELCGVWKKRVQKRHLEDFLIPFGYGDGGGGPVPGPREYALRERDLEGMPKVEMCSPLEFFFEALQAKGGLKTPGMESCASTLTAVYTTQASVKKNNRLSERALHHGIVGCIGVRHGHPYDAEQARRLWKTLLLNQFPRHSAGVFHCQGINEANQALEALQRDAQTLHRRPPGLLSAL